MVGGRRRTEIHISARFARRGRKVLPPPRIVVSDPLGLATRVVTADEPAELLVLPRLEKVVTPPGEGDGTRPGGAPRTPVDRRRGRPRRPAPLPARRGGLAHLLARAGARRRAHGAPAALRRRHAPARSCSTRAGPRARRTSTRPCAPPRRCACTWPARAAARCCCPATGARPSSSRRSSAGRTCTCAWRWSTTAPGPNVAGLASRRGPLLYVAAHHPGRAPRALGHAVGGGRYLDRARRRRAARARPGERRTGAPRRRAPRGVHRGRLHRLRAQRQPPRGGGRLMAATALPRAAAGRRPGARARAPRARPPGRLRRARASSPACTGARSSSPRRAATCSCRCSSRIAGGGRAHRAPHRLARVAAAHRGRRRGLRAAHPRPARRRRAAAHARPAPVGRPRVRHVAGHQLHAGHHRALPRDRRVGAHRRSSRAGRRCWRSPRCWPSGRGAARRRATRSPRRSPSARSTRSRSSSTGPTRRTSTARSSASCSPASCGSSACAPTRSASPRPAWWPRRSSGRSSRRDLDGTAAVVQLRERSPRSSSPPRPRRSRGRTATGR